MIKIKKQTAKMKKSLAVCAVFPKALRGVTCSDYIKSPLRVDILGVTPQALRSALSSKILKSFLNVRNFFSLSSSLRSFLSALQFDTSQKFITFILSLCYGFIIHEFSEMSSHNAQRNAIMIVQNAQKYSLLKLFIFSIIN